MTKPTDALLRMLSTVLLTLAALPAAAQQTATATDALPLWEVTDGHGTVYLLGSIHLLRPETYPLNDAFYAAFEEADVVAFEINLDSAAAAAPMMAMRGMYADGRRLPDVLPADLFAELEGHFTDMGLPIQAVTAMKPWMAALTVTAVLLQGAGYAEAQGVDAHFHARAKEAGKPVIGLETIDEQIDVFDGLSDEDQITFLRGTIEEIDSFVEEMDAMTDMWKRGDADGIAQSMTDGMKDQPTLRHRILDQRNQNWITPIEELLEGGQTSLVIVGMAHLVGTGSVTELLAERGHSISRVPPATQE